MIEAEQEKRQERRQLALHEASELEGQKGRAAVGGDPGIRKTRPTWERSMKGRMAAERSKGKVWGSRWAAEEDKRAGSAPGADKLLQTFLLNA